MKTITLFISLLFASQFSYSQSNCSKKTLKISGEINRFVGLSGFSKPLPYQTLYRRMNGPDNLLEYEYAVDTSAIQKLAKEEGRDLTFKFLRIEVLRDRQVSSSFQLLGTSGTSEMALVQLYRIRHIPSIQQEFMMCN